MDQKNLRLLYWPREYLFHNVKILINEIFFKNIIYLNDVHFDHAFYSICNSFRV